jgi:hypothetical protein
MDSAVPTAPSGREPRRVQVALAALSRWIGWWLATGLIVMGGAMAVAVTLRSTKLDRRGVELLAGLAVAGVLLGTLLWRRRREADGAVAAVILTTGFWIALWMLLWTLTAN